MLDEIENVLLGNAATSASAVYFCQIHIVLASELAYQRGRADVGIIFGFEGAGGLRGRGSFPRLPLCGCGSSGYRRRYSGLGWRGSGSSIAVANDTDDGIDLNGISFGDLNLLEDPAGGSWDFGVDLVGGNLEQRFVALDFLASLFQPLGDSSFEY